MDEFRARARFGVAKSYSPIRGALIVPRNDRNRCPTFSGDRKGRHGSVHSGMFQGVDVYFANVLIVDEDLLAAPHTSLGRTIEFISCRSSFEKKNRHPVANDSFLTLSRLVTRVETGIKYVIADAINP